MVPGQNENRMHLTFICNSCSILMKFLPTECQKRDRMYFSVIIFKYFLEEQFLSNHDLNANLNYLSLNVLSLYCIFDVQNLALCKNIIKIEQELTLE
jgi:hypothetical protein